MDRVLSEASLRSQFRAAIVEGRVQDLQFIGTQFQHFAYETIPAEYVQHQCIAHTIIGWSLAQH